MFDRIKRYRDFKKLRKSLNYLGQGTHIASGCQFNHNNMIYLGENVSIQRDCTFSGHGGISVGNGVVISHCVDVFSGEHNYDSNDLMSLPFDERFNCSEVVIGEYVWIGCHSVILPGVKIGEGAVIGACSVVTKDIPPLAIAVGNPAKVIRYRNAEVYNKLKNEKKGLIEIRNKKHS